jgi:peptidoglycan hydrolase CwlO-like protein
MFLNFKRNYIILFSVAILLLSFFLLNISYAQVGSNEINARRVALENELKNIESEIEKQKDVLESKQRETVSLERDVAILNAQINKSRLSIRARNISINKLNNSINSKRNNIESLNQKLEREKQSLAQLIRKTNEIDSFSLVEVVLSNKDLSEFFADIDSFDAIRESLNKSFSVIEETKNVNSVQKKMLEEKKLEEVELRGIQELQKRNIENKKSERNKILKITKGQENLYKKILNAKKRDATAIRNELFTLRGTAAIPFGKALDFANIASRQTGVSPALILGIITQESNLGENTGQCLLKNSSTGSGIGKNTGRFFKTVMKPPRDTKPFLELAERVGFPPFSTPVSCPPSYGYGGAMGPAQFIPSTWVLFESRIAKLTGHNPPNPWDPSDAFMASAILLKDNGASKGGYRAERLAALRYFAGWKNAKKRAYAFYGDGVMELASKYQKQIDILQSN